MLVLYSRHDQAWKIADFGLTTQGTSKRAQTTHYSRGSPSYRAPERIQDDKYTNKVDIWALGCIFYELIFEGKAFSSDLAVQQYFLENSFSGKLLQLPFRPDMLAYASRKTFISKTIYRMLEVKACKRPAAETLHELFSWRKDDSLDNTHRDLEEDSSTENGENSFYGNVSDH